MNTNWFLGANTAEGFFSRFDQLHPGIRIRKNVIIKGGPGCGKSTFMKTLRGCAEALGADTESYLCSSDPASLDGLFIPALGLAFVDGTAPHADATKKKQARIAPVFMLLFRPLQLPGPCCAACIWRCIPSAPGR